MTVQRVFMYSVKGSKIPLCLHGPDKADYSKLLSLYLDWYNKDFALEECLPPHKIDDFEYLDSYCPIDFYDEYNQECK